MTEKLTLDAIIAQFQQSWQQLPDYRKPSNNTKYEVADAAKAAFSVFFMQSPSFLAHQRDLNKRKGKDNAKTLFGIRKLPSDAQTRNLLDPVTPDQFHQEFNWLHEQLEASGEMAAFDDYRGLQLIGFDGTDYHSSKKIGCDNCTKRKDRNGVTHYYHKAVIPVMVKPGSKHVLSLPPECIVPQDGHKKQDCERAAVKRWLKRHHLHKKPRSFIYLGDDLYANHPLCQLIDTTYQQYFVFVCKPDSHKELYRYLDSAAGIEVTHSKQKRKWNGRHGEIWTYRFANHVPIRGGDDALRVNWFELIITHEESGAVLFHNSWVSNLPVTRSNVAQLARIGRARWKVENENINVLKTKGYNLDHNFGHGKQHLCNVFFTLNLLSFLVHTIQHLVNRPYRLLRETLSVRRTFFNDLRALTRYVVFTDWDSLFAFMLDGLELTLPPP